MARIEAADARDVAHHSAEATATAVESVGSAVRDAEESVIQSAAAARDGATAAAARTRAASKRAERDAKTAASLAAEAFDAMKSSVKHKLSRRPQEPAKERKEGTAAP